MLNCACSFAILFSKSDSKYDKDVWKMPLYEI